MNKSGVLGFSDKTDSSIQLSNSNKPACMYICVH